MYLVTVREDGVEHGAEVEADSPADALRLVRRMIQRGIGVGTTRDQLVMFTRAAVLSVPLDDPAMQGENP